MLELIEKLNGETPRIINNNNIFPNIDRKRKRERVSSIFPTSVQKRQTTNRISPTTSSLEELIQECDTNSIDNPCWMYLATLGKREVFEKMGQVSRKLKLTDLPSFAQKFETALQIWNCSLCKDLSNIHRNLSGYVQCDECKLWYHGECVGYNSDDIDQSAECTWKCSNHVQ